MGGEVNGFVFSSTTSSFSPALRSHTAHCTPLDIIHCIHPSRLPDTFPSSVFFFPLHWRCRRLAGREQFEQDAKLALTDTGLVEEGDVAIDISQYERHQEEDEEEEVAEGVGALQLGKGEISDDE
jgi:hypothetical protein